MKSQARNASARSAACVKRNLTLKQRDRGFDEAPSPEAARKFPYRFHDAEKIEQAQRELYFRGDSACDEEALLSWLRNEKRTVAMRIRKKQRKLLDGFRAVTRATLSITIGAVARGHYREASS
jgi:hypothetical protein